MVSNHEFQNCENDTVGWNMMTSHTRHWAQYHGVEIAEIFSHTFLQTFRERNSFTEEITKYLVV